MSWWKAEFQGRGTGGIRDSEIREQDPPHSMDCRSSNKDLPRRMCKHGGHSGASAGFNHGGVARGVSSRGQSSFGGFHGGGVSMGRPGVELSRWWIVITADGGHVINPAFIIESKLRRRMETHAHDELITETVPGRGSTGGYVSALTLLIVGGFQSSLAQKIGTRSLFRPQESE